MDQRNEGKQNEFEQNEGKRNKSTANKQVKKLIIASICRVTMCDIPFPQQVIFAELDEVEFNAFPYATGMWQGFFNNHQNVRKLNIKAGSISPQQANSLTEMAPNLVEFSMPSNGVISTEFIVQFLQQNTKLRKLHLKLDKPTNLSAELKMWIMTEGKISEYEGSVSFEKTI